MPKRKRRAATSTEFFALIEEMQAVDTRGIEPMAHAQDLAQPSTPRRGDRNESARRLSGRIARGRGRAVSGAEGDE